jgi:hypothetical protein
LDQKLTEVIAAEFAVHPRPPVIEGIDVRIAADGVSNPFPASIGPALAFLRHEIHALILGQNDAALIRHRFNEHGPQIGAFESNTHDVISEKYEEYEKFEKKVPAGTRSPRSGGC